MMKKQSSYITIEGSYFPTTQDKRLALIGSRKTSRGEAERAYALGYLMVQKGYTVVSGLAEGVDNYGMLGAIDAIKAGFTGGLIGIAPCFSGEIYPLKAGNLFEETKKYGYILYPYSSEILDYELYQKRCYGRVFGKYDIKPLLTDRSVLNGEICSQVHIVCDKDEVSGGSRYAPAIAWKNGAKVYKWNSNGERTEFFKLDKKPFISVPLHSKKEILKLMEIANYGIITE